ncbi:unnamed protein product [Brassica oleracea]
MDHQNVPITKKLWNVVRFLLYIIRKRVRKHKLIADFSATLKRGKNLMFHHRRRLHFLKRSKRCFISCRNCTSKPQ